MTSPLTDTSPMPYGKYKGIQMQEVPASYLLWLYDNKKDDPQVREYITDHKDVLLLEIKKENRYK